ncbi:MAG: endolytic transglycosylase MltG [Hyphomicrobiaceae bacterium]
MFSAIFILVVGVATSILWFQHSVVSPGPLTETRSFVIERGESARRVAARLRQDRIISSEALFTAHYLTQSFWQTTVEKSQPLNLKAGRFEFEPRESIAGVMAILAQGRTRPNVITFPEGMTSAAIVRRLAEDERLVGEVVATPPEGLLMPATYDIGPGTARQDIIDRMIREQSALVERLWQTRSPGLPISSPEAAVTLASIVQREMGPNDDPKRIAAVFHNRLRKGMRLQSDPTILYGLFGGDVNWAKPILRSEIRTTTPHNTYRIDGLPPTPICNPGRAALEAVLQPAATNDLFFVADGRGGHVFAETLDEHRRNVQRWREIERAIRERQRGAADQDQANDERDILDDPDPDAQGEPTRETPASAPAAAQPPNTPIGVARPVRTSDITPDRPPGDAGTIVPLPRRRPTQQN